MRRVNLYVIGGVLLGLGIGFFLGVLFVRYRQGVRSEVLDAEWEAWHYPGAESNGSGSAGGPGLLRLNAGPVRRAGLTTPDSFEDVLGFYAGHAGYDWRTAGVSGARATRAGLLDEEALVYSTDSTRPDGKPRPVRVQAVGRRTATHDVTVVISRAEGEEHTHVVLLWFPRR